jgi:hypothetical protein
MASKEHKRQTIFPGSDQRSGLFRKEHQIPAPARNPPIISKREVLEIPETVKRSNNDGDKAKLPRMLPINPVTSYNELVPVTEGSPWNYYKNAFTLELGGSIAVVRKKKATLDLFTTRSFPAYRAEAKLEILRQLRHPNILVSHEVYSFEDAFYVISEQTEVSLEELIIARPNEVQLAAIIYQVSYRFHSMTRDLT